MHSQTKSTRGKQLVCGRHGCGEQIMPGENYYSWSFYRGSTQVRCYRHPPRQSETTGSRMAEVYSAIEAAQDAMGDTEDVAAVKQLVQDVVSAVDEVSEEYRQAAEAFGGQGEIADRADELESWSSDLQSFEPDEPDDPEDEDDVDDKLQSARDDASDLLGGCPL